MDPVVHFELPADDMERVKKFYSNVFGWHMNQLGAEMGNYVVVHTSETDDKNMISQPGRINGGLYKRSQPEQGPSVVIAVEDINVAMQKVKDAGGKVLGGMAGPETPDDIPGVGLHCAIMDSEGNRVSILQPKDMQRG